LFLAETETFVWPPQRANEEEFQPTLTTTIFLPNGSESKRKVKKGTESISPYQVFHGSKSLRQRLTARSSMSSLTFFCQDRSSACSSPAPFGHI
jgi:hypothetical protein